MAAYDPSLILQILFALALFGGGVTLIIIGWTKVFPKPAVAPAPAVAPVKSWWWGIIGGAVAALVGIVWLNSLIPWLALVIALGFGALVVVLSVLRVGANKWLIAGIVVGSLIALGAIAYLIPVVATSNFALPQASSATSKMTDEQLSAYIQAEVDRKIAEAQKSSNSSISSSDTSQAAIPAEGRTPAADLGPWAPGGVGETFEVTCNETVCAGTHVQLWWPAGSHQKWEKQEISVFIPAGLSIEVQQGAGRGWEYPLSYTIDEINAQISADNTRRSTDTSFYGQVDIDTLIQTGLVKVRFDRRSK